MRFKWDYSQLSPERQSGRLASNPNEPVPFQNLCDHDGIRTFDRLLRRQRVYPLFGHKKSTSLKVLHIILQDKIILSVCNEYTPVFYKICYPDSGKLDECYVI